MSEVTVLDYTVWGRTSVRSIAGEFSSVRELKLAVADAVGIPPHRLLLLNKDYLMPDEMEDPIFLELRDLGRISVRQRLPDDAVLTLTVRRAGKRPDECSINLRADAPVSQLKDFVARKYRVPQWKQELISLETTMLDDKAVAYYAVTRETDVLLLINRSSRVRALGPVAVTVRESRTMRQTRITVDKRDTLEVLLGHLERAGLLEPTEIGHIYAGDELQPTGKTFEDTKLHGLLMLVKERAQ